MRRQRRTRIPEVRTMPSITGSDASGRGRFSRFWGGLSGCFSPVSTRAYPAYPKPYPDPLKPVEKLCGISKNVFPDFCRRL